ncbi:hypothetical protein Q7P37_005956 [Cladosporium fusiforme]
MLPSVASKLKNITSEASLLTTSGFTLAEAESASWKVSYFLRTALPARSATHDRPKHHHDRSSQALGQRLLQYHSTSSFIISNIQNRNAEELLCSHSFVPLRPYFDVTDQHHRATIASVTDTTLILAGNMAYNQDTLKFNVPEELTQHGTPGLINFTGGAIVSGEDRDTHAGNGGDRAFNDDDDEGAYGMPTCPMNEDPFAPINGQVQYGQPFHPATNIDSQFTGREPFWNYQHEGQSSANTDGAGFRSGSGYTESIADTSSMMPVDEMVFDSSSSKYEYFDLSEQWQWVVDPSARGSFGNSGASGMSDADSRPQDIPQTSLEVFEDATAANRTQFGATQEAGLHRGEETIFTCSVAGCLLIFDKIGERNNTMSVLSSASIKIAINVVQTRKT